MLIRNSVLWHNLNQLHTGSWCNQLLITLLELSHDDAVKEHIFLWQTGSIGNTTLEEWLDGFKCSDHHQVPQGPTHAGDSRIGHHHCRTNECHCTDCVDCRCLVPLPRWTQHSARGCTSCGHWRCAADDAATNTERGQQAIYHLHEDKSNMHDDFRTLLIDTFNL